MRTAQRMGIKTVAVHSDADTGTPHTRLADEAVHIGASASADSYLNAERIIKAAVKCGAGAIHPGFGFLSENAAFVAAVEKAGLVFIGPSSHAIDVMGDKIKSKALASSAGVSVVPGTPGEIEDVDAGLKAAKKIGYPVMVKASAGGGGKGMRVIERAEDLGDGMRAAMAEAKAAFGDSRVFIEKFITRPRHIEIQLLGDSHGNIVYVGERECSIQRRHQKVIEESPSPFISEKTRKAMGKQAVDLGRAVDYRSAGTVEFIVGADQDFYFLEMNTRLQVEHPVTEMVYGIDLVEKMIRIAAGEKLGLAQKDMKKKGWAIEARVYAEDPSRGFLPSIGQLTRYREPAGEGVRVDSGVDEGGEISMFYDPMIAKLVAHAPQRKAAIERLATALDHYEIDGIESNRQFLAAVLANAAFIKGDLTTGFIESEFKGDFTPPAPKKADLAAMTAIGVAMVAHRAGERHRGDPEWAHIAVDQFGGRHEVVVESLEDARAVVRVDGRKMRIEGPLAGQVWMFTGSVNGTSMTVQTRMRGHNVSLARGAERLVLGVLPARFAAVLDFMPRGGDTSSADEIAAPMPGQVTRLLLKQGDRVNKGQEVAVIEAMKMENILRSEVKAVVAKVLVSKGDNLNVDDVIYRLKPDGDG